MYDNVTSITWRNCWRELVPMAFKEETLQGGVTVKLTSHKCIIKSLVCLRNDSE